jgi:hypothetical protein
VKPELRHALLSVISQPNTLTGVPNWSGFEKGVVMILSMPRGSVVEATIILGFGFMVQLMRRTFFADDKGLVMLRYAESTIATWDTVAIAFGQENLSHTI